MKEPIYIECKCENETNYGIYYNDKEFIINSCCGGCVVASGVKYCPFCGELLKLRRID